ncbi:MAG: N-acetyl sugar amidotransferase [Gammaproteobacteria bacterium]
MNDIGARIRGERDAGVALCVRCIMDTSDPEIVFDERGICNHCKQYDARVTAEIAPSDERERKLEALVEEIRRASRGKDYDCIIGVSGGVDSTMVAYTVKELGLRPLAVHFDNGWNSELAVSNIEKTLKALDIDLRTYVADWDEFRSIQLALFKSGVANIEVVTDHAIMALLFRTASNEGVKYVISGGNIATESVMPESWMYDNRDLRHITAINRLFGEKRIRSLPRCSLARYFYYFFIRRIKYVPILNYVTYDKQAAKKLIQEKLGWRDYGGKHYESIFTRFFQAYFLPRRFNIDKRRAHLSSLILAGQISREEALLDVEKPLHDAETERSDLEFFRKKMRLSEKEFSEIMNIPKRTHRDYPSNRFVFERHDGWVIRFVKRIVRPRALQ